MKNAELIRRLNERLKETKLSDRKASLKAGLNADAIRNIRRGWAPRAETLRALARRSFNIDPSILLDAAGDHIEDGDDADPAGLPPGSGTVAVRELDVRAAAGLNTSAIEILEGNEDGSTVGWYAFPERAFRDVYGTVPDRVRIIEVVGDSNVPELWPGQKLMVDVGDRVPSPPGFFVLWDGLGLVIKQVEFIPNSDPATVKISSANPRYATYERTIEEAHIMARVIGGWRRL